MPLNADMNRRPVSFVRRTLGGVIAFSPLALSLVSVFSGLLQHRQSNFIGVGFMIPAAAFAAINFYLSFIRPRLFYRRHGSMVGYHFISGIPIIGSILVFWGALHGFGAIGSALIGVVSFCLDTGGSGWFVIATWKDQSFWDTWKT